MQKTFSFYPNTGFWFLLLIPLVFFGFYPTYFAVLFKPTPSVIHIHFGLMTIWIIILMVQPFLFRYKKLAVHRKIGRLTYFLFPLILISAFFMIRFSYYRFIGDMSQKNVGLKSEQILKDAATYEAIAFLYLGWLALFYLLAIINRRPSSVHARYMVATALTMLGPTVDRIVYFIFKMPKLGGLIPIETVSFFLIDTTLAILLWNDYKSGRPTKALVTGLSIFIAGQILYFLVQKTNAWGSFVSSIMQPAP